MYHYIKDKEFLSKLYSTGSDIINQLVQQINNDNVLKVSAHLVGSGAKRLITQNGDKDVDLDYNLQILKSSLTSGRDIKNYIMEQYNEVLQRNGWNYCKDSTSVISTEYRVFKRGNKTGFKIDLAIVKKDNNGWHRLVHRKTGFVNHDEYYWNLSPNSHTLDKKINWLKDNGKWNNVRDTYLEKKNMYLCRNDNNHPSFVVYIETINELYDCLQ